jgi:hypothetical protein
VSFDLMLNVVNQIFGGATALFGRALRGFDSTIYRIGDSAFDSLTSAFELNSRSTDFC